MAPDDSKALKSLGSLLYRLGQYTEAEDYLQKAQSIDPESWSITFDLALTKYAVGNLSASEALFSEAIARAPDDATRKLLSALMAYPVLASGDYRREKPSFS